MSQVNGLHVARYHPDASGPPVVLVHGAPDRSKNLAHVVHGLSDLRVTTYDRRGYGRSLDAATAADGTRTGGFAAHARDLIDVLDGTSSVVCGQSAGGTISMMAAIAEPSLFLALGAWEPPIVACEWWNGPEPLEQTQRWADHGDAEQLGEDVNRMILGDERWASLPARTRDMLRAEGHAFRADMASQLVPVMDLSLLESPFVVGCGTLASEDFFAAHHRLAERTDAEIFVGDGADHYAHLSRPDVWVDFVRRTVSLVAAPSAR